jgi:hypothetical protein
MSYSIVKDRAEHLAMLDAAYKQRLTSFVIRQTKVSIAVFRVNPSCRF